MSLALKQLRKERKDNRHGALKEILFGCLCLVPILLIAALVIGLVFGKSRKELRADEARRIANKTQEFNYYYGELWATWFPHKYRTKEQIVRQDLGLDPKDKRLCAMGGIGYVCADAPSTWMPGDVATALLVREDIRRESGNAAAAQWFQEWGWAQRNGAGWGFFSH